MRKLEIKVTDTQFVQQLQTQVEDVFDRNLQRCLDPNIGLKLLIKLPLIILTKEMSHKPMN